MTLNILLGCQQKEVEADNIEKVKLTNVFAGDQLTFDSISMCAICICLTAGYMSAAMNISQDRNVSRLAEYIDGELSIVEFPEDIEYETLGILDGRFVFLTYQFDMGKGRFL